MHERVQSEVTRRKRYEVIHYSDAGTAVEDGDERGPEEITGGDGEVELGVGGVAVEVGGDVGVGVEEAFEAAGEGDRVEDYGDELGGEAGGGAGFGGVR